MQTVLEYSIAAGCLVAIVSVGMIPILVLVGVRKWRDASGRRSPLTRDLLRPPGHSMSLALQMLDEEFGTLLAFTFFLPSLIFAAHLAHSHLLGAADSSIRIGVSVAVLIGGLTFCTWRLLRIGRKRQRFRAAYDCELATAEELNQLMLAGCRVFHDVPSDYGNIDHVVISPSGVFSVNTKAIGKSQGGDGSAKAKVDYGRNVIQFPGRSYPIPIDQLETEARWLSNYLSKAVGEQLSVEPLLALPGWFIERTNGRGSPVVFNPKNAEKFFLHNRRVLSEQTVERIAHQLDQRCRDVEPAFKRTVPSLAKV